MSRHTVIVTLDEWQHHNLTSIDEDDDKDNEDDKDDDADGYSYVMKIIKNRRNIREVHRWWGTTKDWRWQILPEANNGDGEDDDGNAA